MDPIKVLLNCGCDVCGLRWQPYQLPSEPEPECPVCQRKADNARMRRCISFLSSAIKSGEPWTDECEEMVNDALNPKGGEQGKP